MNEKNLDFDRIVERNNTDCLKYDFAVKRGKPQGILPLWVADMDFPTSSKILDVINERVKHGIFGYTESSEDYFEAVNQWMLKRYNWRVKENWLVKTPGVVFALAMAVKAFTEVGDCVLIQQPVYYPFQEVIQENDRIVVSNDLLIDADGNYTMDFERFEQQIIEHKIKLFILCSPHNPVGRVWTKEELLRIGEICLAHHVIVVSDEIHADFTFGKNQHHVFANLNKAFESISIICTSPGKTFNLAGLQVSNIFIPSDKLRYAFQKQIYATGYSQLNTVGLIACEAAYREGEEWYQGMLAYVEKNIEFVKNFFETELPNVKVTPTQGTYLVWIDFRKLGLTGAQLDELMVKEAGVWLDTGRMFGPMGEGFERINVACPKKVLEIALRKIKNAVKSIDRN